MDTGTSVKRDFSVNLATGELSLFDNLRMPFVVHSTARTVRARFI